jgi:dihydroorotase
MMEKIAPQPLVLRGGVLLDPKNAVHRSLDVAVQDGRVLEVGEGLAGRLPFQVIDVGGLLLTPALVDLHTHLFFTPGLRDAWAGDESVAPDGFSFRTGVTTMVDAGSAGWRNFDTFRVSVIDRAQTRVFAFLNIAGFGMISDMIEQDPRDFLPEIAADTIRKHRDVLVGVKSAHYQGPDWSSVERAVQAGELAGVPVMVDFGYFRRERPYWRLVTEKLRPGDISTHCFRGTVPVADQRGRLFAYLRRARERGVLFDLGHGQGSFLFRNAVAAIREGFYPDTVSSDLHGGSMNAAMIDLPTVMSKLLAAGMPLEEVVARATWAPARLIGHPELGQLAPGAPADIAAWRVMEGQFGFADTAGGRLTGTRRLACELTLKEGRVMWDWNARTAADYETLGPRSGIREGLEEILIPEQPEGQP